MDSKYSCFINLCTCNNVIKKLPRSAKMFAEFSNVLGLMLLVEIFMSKALVKECREGFILLFHGIHFLKYAMAIVAKKSTSVHNHQYDY